MARNGITRQQAEARVRAQARRDERLAVADRVVDNSGDPASTVSQVDEIWTWLRDH
jgi:dephospho-CoA kinase